MLFEVEEECNANGAPKPTRQQVIHLQNTLSQLSAGATEASADGGDPDGQLNRAFSDATRSTLSSDDAPEWSSGDVTTSSSEVSNINFPQFDFLQAAFPHIEPAKLRSVIVAVGGPDGSADMEDVVEEVLNRENRRECQERGVDVDTLLYDRPKDKPRVGKVPPVKKKKGTKLVINDIRQQHHLSNPSSPKSFIPHPWVQTMSLSTHLATLIPSCNADRFQSAFHDPQHSSPSKAIRHILQKTNTRLDSGEGEFSEQETAYLFELFDTLRAAPAYENMTVEQQDQLLSDARLALRATGGVPDSAWELVSTLLDLDHLDIGIYHAIPPTPSPPTPKKLVPVYDPNRKAKVRGAGNEFGKGGKGDVGELDPLQRIAQLRRSRNAILREATRYWNRGNSGNRGGEVAQYFAERVGYPTSSIRGDYANSFSTGPGEGRTTSSESGGITDRS